MTYLHIQLLQQEEFSRFILSSSIKLLTELHDIHTFRTNAGPTGGDGLAAPPRTCNLIIALISLAII